MAAMKPRTGDGPLEVTKEGRGIVMRVPLEGGGRLVVELTPDEAKALTNALESAVGGHGAPDAAHRSRHPAQPPRARRGRRLPPPAGPGHPGPVARCAPPRR